MLEGGGVQDSYLTSDLVCVCVGGGGGGGKRVRRGKKKEKRCNLRPLLINMSSTVAGVEGIVRCL